MALKNRILHYLLLSWLLLPAVSSLFRPGFFPSHDGEWMVIRLSDFHRSLMAGIFPVRWASRLNHDYGYPVFNFLYPLSLYLGEFFHLLGFDFVVSIKLVFIASFFFSGWLMFFWLKEKFGPSTGGLAALAAALFYVYSPYRLVDVYVRGSLGEALAFVFPPLLFWSLERLAQSFDRRALVIGAFALAGLIMAHNTLALLFIFFLGFYVLYLFSQKKSLFIIHHSSFIILLGLGLSAFFWLPALYDQQFVIFKKAVVSNSLAHFPTLRQLIVPSWGYGPSLPFSDQETISFQIGFFHLIIGFLAWRYCHRFFRLSFWLVFFLMLPVSSLIWRFLPFANLIQFPWRLLALTTFISAILAGSFASQLSRSHQFVFLILAAGFFLYQAWFYARPEYFINRPLSFYTTNEATTNVANEYTPIWVKEIPTTRAEEKVEIVSGGGEIEGLTQNPKRLSFQAKLNQPSWLRINTHFFPGWQLFVNGQPKSIDYQENGLIEFSLPAGKFSVATVFKETSPRLIADVISLLSLGLAIIIFLKKR